jgi:SSS family solute:Na+ symporter
VFGLGFVLSFGYWTTNFAEVQRALSAKDLTAGQRTPLIGAYPKIFIPALTIIPGLVALACHPQTGHAQGRLTYNNAIPLLMGRYLPNGALGVALAGLLAAFMAGHGGQRQLVQHRLHLRHLADLHQEGRRDRYYLNVGRVVTVVGILIGSARRSSPLATATS